MTPRRLIAAATAAVIASALVVAGLFATSSTSSSSDVTSEDHRGSILVIGTGGLSWSDVSAEATPAVWSLLRDGATATLVVRSVHANACPVDGWLSLSAGERAGDSRGGVAGMDRSSEGKPPCQALPTEPRAGKVPNWDDFLAAAAATRYDASLGLLGDQVARHGRCIQAVGPGAALGIARGNGIVDRYRPYDPSTLTAAVASCPATLIDVGQVRDPADIDPGDDQALRPTTSRAKQVSAVDARVGEVLKAAPSGTDVLLVSLADAGSTERLRLIAATGPHFGVGTLQSASTRQPGIVQLADLAPTILEHLGVTPPPSLGGSPLRFVPGDGNSTQSTASRLRALLDYDEASHEVHSLVAPFFTGWALLQLAIYLFAAVLWRRGWGSPPQRKQLLTVTHHVAIIAATVPVSTFLANLIPWWRFPVPMIGAVVAVAVYAGAISLLALWGPWRKHLFGPMVVICVATVAVLAADVMNGSRLQQSSLLGLQPVVGGRFYGMGNVTFALFGTATLMLCIAVGSHLLTLGRPRLAAAAVAAVGMGAVIVDGSPSWGSDLGGPTALLPGVILLILAILQIKATWRRLLAIGGGIAVFVVMLAWLDWLRPAESRSHLGRFVQTTVDGGAWDIILRKLEQNVTLLFGNPLSPLIPVGLIVLAYVLARPSSGAAVSLRRPFARVLLLRQGLIAVLVMWVLGFVLNDSGVAIPVVGATLAMPLTLAITLRAFEDERLATPSTTRASRLLR